MLERIKKFFEFSSKEGLHLPMAHDATKGKPSITLLIFYIAMIMTAISLTAFHFLPDKLLQPALLTLTFLAMAFVFYRLRNLDKVKLDLDDKSIELDGGDNGSDGEGTTTSGGESSKPQGE